jgi:hypothetical protein
MDFYSHAYKLSQLEVENFVRQRVTAVSKAGHPRPTGVRNHTRLLGFPANRQFRMIQNRRTSSIDDTEQKNFIHWWYGTDELHPLMIQNRRTSSIDDTEQKNFIHWWYRTEELHPLMIQNRRTLSIDDTEQMSFIHWWYRTQELYPLMTQNRGTSSIDDTEHKNFIHWRYRTQELNHRHSHITQEKRRRFI